MAVIIVHELELINIYQVQRTKLRNKTVQHNSQSLGKSIQNGKGVDNKEPLFNIFFYETAAVDHYIHYNEAENRHKNDDTIIFHILYTTVRLCIRHFHITDCYIKFTK